MTDLGHDRGPWISTFTGGKFYLLDPQSEDIEIEDIAHSLAQQNRFNGHTLFPYSVAQHSVLACDIVGDGDARLALTTLLHDATEAFIGDMVSPLKSQDTFFKTVEDNVWVAIAEKFDLHDPMPQEVHDADRLMLSAEARDIFPQADLWSDMPDPSGIKRITRWSWMKSKRVFLERYEELVRQLEKAAA